MSYIENLYIVFSVIRIFEDILSYASGAGLQSLPLSPMGNRRESIYINVCVWFIASCLLKSNCITMIQLLTISV